MPFVFIRHAKKAFNNGYGTPAHDPPLKHENLKAEVKALVADLMARYGKPDIIYVSPFARTRETSEYIKQELWDNYSSKVNIVVDNHLQEYLGHQKPCRAKAELSEITSIYTQPLLGVETLDECRDRAVTFFNIYKQDNYKKWVITHGILMDYLYNHINNKKVMFKFKELEYFTHGF